MISPLVVADLALLLDEHERHRGDGLGGATALVAMDLVFQELQPVESRLRRDEYPRALLPPKGARRPNKNRERAAENDRADAQGTRDICPFYWAGFVVLCDAL
jgi:hypothetical protein